MDENKAYWSEDEWRKNNWRCGHGWLRGEQCEICNAPKREWVGLTDEEVYLNCPSWLSQEQCKVWIQQIEAKLKERNT